MMSRYRFAAGAALLALAGLAYTGVFTPRASASKPQAPTAPGMVQFPPGDARLSFLKVEAVRAAPLPVAEPLNARVAYDESVTSRVASPVAGRVLSAVPEIGDRVRRGAALAELDAPDFAAAEADWRKAAADEKRKDLAFARARTLYEGDAVPRKDVESAEADLAQARAETRRASLRMHNLRGQGREDGRFVLAAPLDGVIADKQVNPGMEVRPDLATPLFVVSDLSRLWVIVDVPERLAQSLHAGQRAEVETDATVGRIPARIDRVGLALDPATRRVQVRCTLANPGGQLKPEMFARVAFLTDDEKASGVPVPNTALFVEGKYSFVFVERAAGNFEKRRVHLRLNGQERSVVDAGLADGERVVTEGALLLNAEAGGHDR